MSAQPSVATLAIDFLTDEERAEILGHGRIHDTSSVRTSGGPLRPEVRLRPKGLEVAQFTGQAWASQVAWHTYWAANHYKTKDEALCAAGPLEPRHEQHYVCVSWAQLREWLRELEPQKLESADEQLSFEMAS